MDSATLISIGVTMILVGIVVIVVALLLLSVSRRRETAGIKGGGVILIGPLPVIFGTDRQSLKAVIILAIILMIVALIATIVFYFSLR